MAGRLANEIWMNFEIFKILYRLKGQHTGNFIMGSHATTRDFTTYKTINKTDMTKSRNGLENGLANEPDQFH